MLQEKEIDILTTISNLRFMNSNQVHLLYGYEGRYGRSVTRRKLLQLERKRLLHSWQPSKYEPKVFYITKEGAETVKFFHGYHNVRTYRRTDKTAHQVLVSEVYTILRLERGKVRRFGINSQIGEVVCDAFVQYDIDSRSKLFFLEVDRATESLSYIKDIKFKAYETLYNSNVLQRKFGLFPDVMFVTISDSRKRSLLNLKEEFNFRIKVFNLGEFVANPLCIL